MVLLLKYFGVRLEIEVTYTLLMHFILGWLSDMLDHEVLRFLVKGRFESGIHTQITTVNSSRNLLDFGLHIGGVSHNSSKMLWSSKRRDTPWLCTLPTIFGNLALEGLRVSRLGVGNGSV